MMNKKGISAVVATVLIVLITVAAVTIIWAAIMPLIDKNLDESTACFNAQNSLTIDDAVTYSCFDATADTVDIRVQRGSSDAELKGLEIYIDVNGDTTTIEKTDVPDINGAKVYSGLAVATVSTDTVKAYVAPIIDFNGEDKVCEKSPEKTIKACA